MSALPGGTIEIDAGLAEEAVLLAMESAAEEERRLFRSERDAIYALGDAETKEARFRDLHSRWFECQGLGETLRTILCEPMAAGGTVPAPGRCVVLRAAGRKQEGADLHDAAAGPVLAVRLMPRTLLDEAFLRVLLRREMLHVSDMLDPEFGYTRTLPAGGDDPARDGEIRDRYRVLWDVAVDGRLVATGLLPPEVESMRRREFSAAFPMLPPVEARERFDRLFRGPRPRHDDLWALAADPAGGGVPRCAVCRFPTRSFHPAAQTLDPEVVESIRRDIPTWRREEGLCLQCADLYASRTRRGIRCEA